MLEDDVEQSYEMELNIPNPVPGIVDRTIKHYQKIFPEMEVGTLGNVPAIYADERVKEYRRNPNYKGIEIHVGETAFTARGIDSNLRAIILLSKSKGKKKYSSIGKF